MKYFHFLLFLSVVSLSTLQSKAQDKPGSIQVKMTHFNSTEGTVQVSIFNMAEGFPTDESKIYKKLRTTINSDKTAVVTFTGLAAGEYAVAMHHDENNSGEMEYNWIGMPKEGYGFSRNFKPTIRAPKFHETNISLDQEANKVITIKVLY